MASVFLLHDKGRGHDHGHAYHEHAGHDDHYHDHPHPHAKAAQGPAASKDHNLQAAYFHVLADALTSILAIVGLVAGRNYG